MQPRLPLKWRLFRIITIFHLSGVAVITILAAYAFFKDWDEKSNGDMLIFISVMLMIAALITNSIISLILLDRHYPDKLPGPTLSGLIIIVFIISLILLFFLLILFSYGLYTEIQGRSDLDFIGWLLMWAIISIILTGFYICWFQVVLKKTLKKNYTLFVDNFLNTDEHA